MTDLKITTPEQSKTHLLANIIKHSVNDFGTEICTMHVRYPRCLLPEFNTHRVFSRNTRSSRAVPIAKMIEEIENIPYIPWHWTGHKPGMQGVAGYDAGVDITGDDFDPYTNVKAWLWARDKAVQAAKAFNKAGYHKQLVNRLLEPFMWVDTLVTATDWDNFFWLRCHEAAEPHFHDLAVLMLDTLEASKPQHLKWGEWHLPYIEEKDIEAAKDSDDNLFLQKISAARCARISYVPFDGNSTYEKELSRYDLLVSSDRVHASPVEHQVQVERDLETGYNGNLNGPGIIQFRKLIPNEAHTGRETDDKRNAA